MFFREHRGRSHLFGNTKEIAAGNYTLVSYTSHPNNGKVLTQTYGGTDENGNPVGLVIKYLYDVLDRVTEIQYNIGVSNAFTTVYSYTYDAGGRLNSVTNHRENLVTRYSYDARGKLLHTYTYDLATKKILYAEQFTYDIQERIAGKRESFEYTNSTGSLSTESLAHYYEYGKMGELDKLTVIDYGYTSIIIDPTYDILGRLTASVTEYKRNTDSFNIKQTYTYDTFSGDGQMQTSSQVSTLTNYTGTNTVTSQYSYSYDSNGNIVQINDASGVLCRYEYDSLGQLTREDNRLLNKSFTYTYDTAGNMTSKKTYAYTTGTLGSATSTQSFGYNDHSPFNNTKALMIDDLFAIISAFFTRSSLSCHYLLFNLPSTFPQHTASSKLRSKISP